MNKILLFILILFGKVPRKVFYFLSELLFFFVYRIIKYRIDTVKENLKNSFPKHSLTDLIKIEKKFYRNFCDILLENLLIYSITEKELQKRMKLLNPEVFDSLHAKDKGAIYLACYRFSEKVKEELNWTDSLRISLTSKEFITWLDNEAY